MDPRAGLLSAEVWNKQRVDIARSLERSLDPVHDLVGEFEELLKNLRAAHGERTHTVFRRFRKKLNHSKPHFLSVLERAEGCWVAWEKFV